MTQRTTEAAIPMDREGWLALAGLLHSVAEAIEVAPAPCVDGNHEAVEASLAKLFQAILDTSPQTGSEVVTAALEAGKTLVESDATAYDVAYSILGDLGPDSPP